MSLSTSMPSAVLAEAAHKMDTAGDLRGSLQALVDIAQQLLEGIDDAGISVIDRAGASQVQAGTGPLVWQLDAVQGRLREGPGIDLMKAGGLRTIVVDGVPQQQAWPRYVRRASCLGLKAQVVSGPLGEGDVKSVLSLYSVHAEQICPDVALVAEGLARLAGTALGEAAVCC